MLLFKVYQSGLNSLAYRSVKLPSGFPYIFIYLHLYSSLLFQTHF
jgi:hypothetical protein